MNIQKQQIQEALKSVKVKGDEKSLIENNLVTNIVVFGDEVNIDLLFIILPFMQRSK